MSMTHHSKFKLDTWCTICSNALRFLPAHAHTSHKFGNVLRTTILLSARTCAHFLHIFFIFCNKKLEKEYFPNLLEITLLCQIFVFWVRDFKLWLLAYFLISFDYAKFQKHWATFILDILQWSPLWIFGESQKQKTPKGGPL